MKICLFSFLLFGILHSLSAQQPKKEFEMTEGGKTYNMKQYYMVILLKGDHRNQPKEEADKIQAAHLAGIRKLADAGIIQIAGPFAHDEDPRGIFIMDVKDIDEAKRIVDQDPAVRSGRLKYRVYPWWAAKGSTLK